MASERFNQIQAEINAKLEKLKNSNDPSERRALMLNLKRLLTELDRIVASAD